MQSDYEKYRGKCKEYVDKAVEVDPSLTAVQGWYVCLYRGVKEPHWWCVDKKGKIYDPTKKQFLSHGLGDYIPYEGIVECAECGIKILEQDAHFDGNYAFCKGTNCYAIFVGLGDYV